MSPAGNSVGERVAPQPAAPPRPLLRWLVGGYLALTLGGFLVFKFGPVTAAGHEMSAIRAAFMAVNAATLTGFQSSVGLEDLDEHGVVGPVTVLTLTLGGALFSLVAGGIAAVRALRLPYSDGQVASAAFATLLIAVLAGATPLLSPERRMFQSVFLAAGAFANSGLYVGRLPGPSGVLTHAVLLPLALAGALGLPVLMELVDRATGTAKRLSTHARTVVVTSAFLYVAATIVFFLLLAPQRHPQSGGHVDEWRDALASSSTLAVNARGAGFPFEFAAAYPRTLHWALLLLMAVGGNPAGTAGGVKATTVVVLAAGVRAALAGRPVSRAFGVAAAWAAAYGAIVFAGVMLLLWRVPDLGADRLLFLAVSAASNVGLSHDPVSTGGPGLYTLSLLMLAGRVAPVLVLWWLARAADDADVAVG